MTGQSKNLSFRWLEAHEFHRVEDCFRQFDWAVPHPAVAAIRVAEHEGQIVGIVAFELMAHLGPVWIAEGYRRNVEIWEEGLRAVQERLEPQGIFPGIIATAETPITESLAKKVGMEKARGVLFVKSWR